jgi:glycosyltransferase involved in cell wall biosynthesis
MEFSVVVPVFNEEESLPLLQKELHETMVKTGLPYEIIYIDDGSCDSSLEVLKELKNQYPKIMVLALARHAGKSAALEAGFKATSGRWIITLDADLQNPPGEILRLLEFKDDADFMMGIRKNRQDYFVRKVSSWVAMSLRRVALGDRTQDIGCALRVFKREVAQTVYLFNNFHRFFAYLARRKGFLVKEVPVAHNLRKFGRSKYGTFQRAVEGLFDLIGVIWLIKRSLTYDIKSKF